MSADQEIPAIFLPEPEPRFLALIVFPVHPFPPPGEIWFVYTVTTRETAIEKAQSGSSRYEAMAAQRLAVNDKPWPDEDPPGTSAYLLRPGHYFVAVPNSWGASRSKDWHKVAPTVRIGSASKDETEARRALETCDVRGFLGRVILIAAGDHGGGGELGGLQKEDINLWSGW